MMYEQLLTSELEILADAEQLLALAKAGHSDQFNRLRDAYLKRITHVQSMTSNVMYCLKLHWHWYASMAKSGASSIRDRAAPMFGWARAPKRVKHRIANRKSSESDGSCRII
jgi:hypothetical protein